MAVFKLKYLCFTLLLVAIIAGAVGIIYYFRKERIGIKPKLIVIAMDGLQFHQIQSDLMPFITEFFFDGVYCPEMQPVFPTKSDPNLFSIATGLYPESHGVTANTIYDNKLHKVIESDADKYMFKSNVTPIWTLNEMAGKHSTVLWPAGDLLYRNISTAHAVPSNVEIPWKRHIDENIIPMFLRKECTVNLAMFNLKQPKVALRAYSPQSKDVANTLKDLDNMVKYLSDRLKAAGLAKATDIIILSDHGMDSYYFHPEYVDGDIIDLYRVVSKDSCDMYGSSPVLQIIARSGYNQTALCYQLKLAAALNGHFKVYTNDDLMEKQTHWHVRNPQRFGPCTCVAEPGYVFQDIRNMLRESRDYEKLAMGERFGIHGYENLAPSMQAVFLARGPRFQHGIEIPSLQNIDLFYLFARLLKIDKLVPNLHIDGKDRLDIWNVMLTDDAFEEEQ